MAWIKKLQNILKHKPEFERFMKIITKIFVFLFILGIIAYFLFVFNWSYNKGNGLKCGGDPVELEKVIK